MGPISHSEDVHKESLPIILLAYLLFCVSMTSLGFFLHFLSKRLKNKLKQRHQRRVREYYLKIGKESTWEHLRYVPIAVHEFLKSVRLRLLYFLKLKYPFSCLSFNRYLDLFFNWPIAVYHEVVMMILSIASNVIFILLTVAVSNDNHQLFFSKWVIWGEFSFSVVFLYDYFVHFLTEESKWKYFLFRVQPVLSLLALMPGLMGPLVGIYLYAFIPLQLVRLKNGVSFLANYGWGRSVRGGMRKLIIYLAAFLLLIYIVSAFIFVTENSVFNKNGQVDNFYEAGYFLIVTVTTVGYGDISPQSWQGQVIVVLFILSALFFRSLFASQA